MYYNIKKKITVLNRPLPKPRSIKPTDFLSALERKSGGTINRDQQVMKT